MKFKRLVESEEPVLLSYLPNKPYKASYIDSAGELFIVDFTPSKEMNIAEAIQTIKRENNNFFKLQGIKELTTEFKNILTEDTNQEDTINPEDFKSYIKDKIESIPEHIYIKQITEDKPNVYNDFYVYLQGRDAYNTETMDRINDVVIRIPYTNSKEETNKNIENAIDELNEIYNTNKIAFIN